MAKRGRGIYLSLPEAEPDTRPIGSLLFADSSGAEFPRRIHPFNDPFSPRARPDNQHGIRTVTARETTFWDPKRTGCHDEEKE